jgi:SAM-dependent methyltransferase
MNCRHCHTPLEHVFLDLGVAPPSNAYLQQAQLDQVETRLPLRLFVCGECWLVQTEDFAAAGDLFTDDYAYFSSVSHSWLHHAAEYAHMIIPRLGLSADSHVIEVASNDGYLLKNFLAAGIPCTGIEPTAATAEAAEALGIPVLREFFGEALAERLAAEGGLADLVIGNNVFAHVPDINDFSRGLRAVLKPAGTVTLEFPHLLQMIRHCQFDTAYHEHFSYLSLGTVSRILGAAGLRVVDVEELGTHGGSLRVYAGHTDEARPESAAVSRVLTDEHSAGLDTLAPYQGFQARADAIRDALLVFLRDASSQGIRVAAYGAAAKGNTLLNYAGVMADLLPVVYDAAPSKQGKYLPGSHIPIRSPAELEADPPDVLLVLPWNIQPEIEDLYGHLRDRGMRFVNAFALAGALDSNS